MLVLSSADVDALVAGISPNELTQLMAAVFRRVSGKSGVDMPHRLSVRTESHNTLFMPSRVDTLGTAIKIVSVPTSGGLNGLPATILVIDEASGGVKAVVNARKLTAIRTAAGSLLATRLALGPSASPRVLVAFGAGAQIAAHITLFLRYYSGSLVRCIIYNRSLNARVESLVESLHRDFASVTFIRRKTPDDTHGVGDDVDSLRSDLESTDIICAATPSTKALFPSSFVRPGTHLNLVGSYTPQMMEVETSLIHRAGLLMVDSRSACMLEAGELIAAGLRPEDVHEIGELVGTGSKVPRRGLSGDRVTIFKSVGLGVQDVAIAKLVVDLAERKGLGCNLNSYDDRNL